MKRFGYLSLKFLSFVALALPLLSVAPMAQATHKFLETRESDYVTAIKAKAGGPGGKEYLSAFYWAGKCGDGRVGVWTSKDLTKDALWRLTKVDPNDIPWETTDAYYYIRAEEMVAQRCDRQYLSAVYDCSEPWIGLYHERDEQGVQRWQIVPGAAGEYNIINVWQKENCATNIYLSTNAEWAYRTLSINTGVNFPNTQFLLTAQPGKKPIEVGKPKGDWTAACSGGQTCTSEIMQSIDIGSIDETSWTKEVRNKLAIAIETSAELEVGPATGGVKVTTSFEHQWSSSEAAKYVRSTTESNKSSCQNTVDMAMHGIGVVWQWSMNAQVDGQTVKMVYCQLTCTKDGGRPAGGPLSAVNLHTCQGVFPD